MRVCIAYDCLYPWTVGGAERWLRQVAEAHVAAGNIVTYLTLQQWPHDEPPALPGIDIVAVAPRMALYAGGRRRIAPPLACGWGVFRHLLRHGRNYDVVHVASFPFFPLLAAGLLRPFHTFRVVVDWHEVWTWAYWRQYLGPLGAIGWLVQWACAKIPQTAFTFSRLHQTRAKALGLGAVTLLEGEYIDPCLPPLAADHPPFVLYAGRMVPEKRVPLLVDALALLMKADPDVGAMLIGRGPDLETVRARIEAHGLADRIALPGYVDADTLTDRFGRAAVLVQPSEREGYGMVVVESAARGVPVVVVAGADNAATELVDAGENGFIAAQADAGPLAEAIASALRDPAQMRRSVRAWYARNRSRLSFEMSFERIVGRLERGDGTDAEH